MTETSQDKRYDSFKHGTPNNCMIDAYILHPISSEDPDVLPSVEVSPRYVQRVALTNIFFVITYRPAEPSGAEDDANPQIPRHTYAQQGIMLSNERAPTGLFKRMHYSWWWSLHTRQSQEWWQDQLKNSTGWLKPSQVSQEVTLYDVVKLTDWRAAMWLGMD